jgi:peptidoglycan/xylan/chitin deacetylase (PgdA/CDA1 family)
MKNPLKSFLFLLLVLSGCVTVPVTPAPANTKSPLQFKNTVVSLTFDDGDADNYSVRSILAENNLRATFYVVSGFTNSNGYMTDNQLRDLYNDGNEIGGHTLSHVKLSEVRGDDLKREICQDRANLLAYGFEANSFAYPFGYYDEEAKRAAMDCGYKNARAVSNGPEILPPLDAFSLRAMPYIVSDTRFPKMTRYVTEAEDGSGGWVIFVFHHVCDGCDQYAIKLEVFAEFAQWLGEQQSNGLVVKTVSEMMNGK